MRRNCVFFLKFIISSIFIITYGYGQSSSDDCANFMVGSAQSDITGPIAEIGLMGYGTLSHRATGLHMRTRSRAMVIADGCDQNIVALVINEQAMIFDNLKREILLRLDKVLPKIFTRENLMLSATHTHAAPGGFGHLTLYNITTLGFLESVHETIVEGTVESITKAYHQRRAGKLYINSGTLPDAGYNRSLAAYNKNPIEEIERYDSDTDTDMTVIRAVDSEGTDIASFNWFAVHPVSLPMSSTLVSGDNKGLAAYLQEKAHGTKYLKDQEFIAGFLQSNAGDISPYPVTIKNYDELDYWSYLRDSANKQFSKAEQLYKNAKTPLNNTIETRGRYLELNQFQYSLDQEEHTCRGMLGVAFAAGTENGAPVPIFKEGTRYGVEWPKITLMPEEQECQGEKVILLPTGAISPAWTAHVLYFQLFKIGELAIVATPFEITSMAGRRLKESVLKEMKGSGVKHVVITALANDYAHYVTTEEEYRSQNYEGGSNLFGPKSLLAYQKIYSDLASSLINKQPIESTIFPQDLSNNQFVVQTGVVLDSAPLGKKFGDVAVEPEEFYQDTEEVSVEFWGAHPKNTLLRNQSFLVVEKQSDNGTMNPIAYDWDDNTKLTWKRNGISKSRIKITWLPNENDKGLFRICHQGGSRSLNGNIKPYLGCSKLFSVN